MFLLLILTITFSLAAKIPEPCCSRKTVGDLSYTLVNSEDTSIASRYGCISNCVYHQDDLPGKLFCFADGDLPATCTDAVSVTANTKPTTTTKSAITTEGNSTILSPDSYLYLTERRILKLPSFDVVNCYQGFPGTESLNWASAGVVTHNNQQELMVCGGYRMAGCRIWTKEGWVKTAENFTKTSAASSMTATGDWLWTGGYYNGQILNNTRLYTESGWQNFTELPEAIGLHCQVYVENKGVYVIGGYNDKRSLDTTYELTSSNEWSKLSSLNTQRRWHACVEWEGGILAIGGYEGFGGDSLSSVERFDPLENKWLPFTALPIPLNEGQAINWKGDVFVFGGDSWTGGEAVQNKEVFKLQKGSETWEVVPGVSIYHDRDIYPAVIINNLHCNN